MQHQVRKEQIAAISFRLSRALVKTRVLSDPRSEDQISVFQTDSGFWRAAFEQGPQHAGIDAGCLGGGTEGFGIGNERIGLPYDRPGKPRPLTGPHHRREPVQRLGRGFLHIHGGIRGAFRPCRRLRSGMVRIGCRNGFRA